MTVEAPGLGQDVPPSVSAQPWPAPKTAWRTLWILSLVLGLSQVDRNILSLLLQPIKDDLKFTDAQMGLLIGLAFSIIYLFLSFPLSRLSDRGNRRTMVALGVAVWSLATAACGLTRSFWPMFAARAGVGAGESVNAPATYSLLADSFPRDKLPRAMAVLNVGFVGGTAISLILGGLVIAALVNVHVVLPVFGAVHTWQLVFFAVGLPGLLVSLLMLTVTEPARRGVGASGPSTAAPVSEVFRYLWRNRRFWGCMFASMFFTGVIIYGTTNFRAAFFARTYHWSGPRYGIVAGLASLLVSPFALVAGTWLCERWNRKHHDGNMRVGVFANAIGVPFTVAAPLMPAAWMSIACSATAAGLVLMAAPPMVAAMQSITPSGVRAQVNSLYILMFSSITGFVGPAFIGWLTDLQHDQTKLGYVMAVSSAVLLPLATGIMFFAIKPFGVLIERIKAEEVSTGS